jgi:hypothetical protein
VNRFMTEPTASMRDRDRQLYERYGRPLESAHKGEYIAISPDGKTILGSRAAEVLRQAIDAFGSGNFALRRVGYRTFGRWLTLSA